jgi:hypothetical protein
MPILQKLEEKESKPSIDLAIPSFSDIDLSTRSISLITS